MEVDKIMVVAVVPLVIEQMYWRYVWEVHQQNQHYPIATGSYTSFGGGGAGNGSPQGPGSDGSPSDFLSMISRVSAFINPPVEVVVQEITITEQLEDLVVVVDLVEVAWRWWSRNIRSRICWW